MVKKRVPGKGLRAATLACYTICAFAIPAPWLPAQCALCKEALESGAGADGARWAMGFSWGILVLLGCVFSLAGGLVSLVVYTVRRAAPPEDGVPLAGRPENTR